MTEDLRQKEIRLRKELAQVRALNANADTKVRKTRADRDWETFIN